MPPINIIGTANLTQCKRGRGRPIGVRNKNHKEVPDIAVALYASGLTLAQVAKRVGLSASTISKSGEIKSIIRSQGYWKKTPEIVARDATFPALYTSGKTLQEIGDMHGLTRERVRQILEIAGVDMSAHNQSEAWSSKLNGRRERRRNLVAALANEGMSRKQIERIIGERYTNLSYKLESPEIARILTNLGRKIGGAKSAAWRATPIGGKKFKAAIVGGWTGNEERKRAQSVRHQALWADPVWRANHMASCAAKRAVRMKTK